MTPLPKGRNAIAPAIRKASAGQDCTLRIEGVCRNDPAYTVGAQMQDRIEELETLIKDFFTLLDKTEETDEGRVFRPNRINSCRAEDGQKLENLLRLMKATVEGRW